MAYVDFEKLAAAKKTPVALSIRQQQFQSLHVGCVDDVAFAQCALTLTGFFCQDMAGERFGISVFTASGSFEPFRSGPVALDFLHNILLT